MDVKTMRALGMLVKSAYPDYNEPEGLIDTIVTRPATGLGLMAQHLASLPTDRQDEVGYIMQSIPADLSDPPDGVCVADQGPFWIGYYHYARGIERSQTHGAAALAKIGEALYGERWQTDLARELGLSDARRVRQWMVGERPIPPGVWTDLHGLLQARRMHIDALIDAMQST
ncbi:hypothetical protein [Chromobacterium phragmitis]|uniref:hypothetical protein n=1 Tax=Chromobacterium phragmitis TaxID=2202141 RepID=UPI003878005B